MQYKIAIIDDSEEDIFAIKRMLLKASNEFEYIIFEFTNPEEALKEIEKNTIDCIILDYNFPAMNGLEFIQEFRNKQNTDIPIIFMTGQGNEKIAVESLKNGAFDYISKSEISKELLKKSIIKGIEKRDFERTEKTYNEFIKTVVNLIPVPLFYKDRNGIYLGCNKEFEDFMGKSKDEIIGKSAYEFTNKSDAEKYTDMDNKLFNNPGTQNYEYQHEKGNNEKRYVSINKVTYNDALGEVSGIIGIINDITEIKIREAELEGKSFIDSLTGILNRRYFDENVENEWRKCVREKKCITIIMIDIDFFKNYNDYYGHPEGDNCLKKIAQEIKISLLRPADLVARYGGEEFVVILPDTDINGAMGVANRIRQNILNIAIESPPLAINKVVTVSQGIAEINDRNDSVYKCLVNADKALYMAKKNGRNTIEALE